MARETAPRERESAIEEREVLTEEEALAHVREHLDDPYLRRFAEALMEVP